MSSLQSVPAAQPSKKKKSKAKAITRLTLVALLAAGTWVALFTADMVTLRGIPYSVLNKVLRDKDSRAALLARNSKALHDRMNMIGVEYDIKRYYSDRIEDPVELDQHIHQVFYNLTGYVGENYVVVRGKLVPKSYDLVEDLYWCPEC